MDKTHAMVFRRPRAAQPSQVLTYRGQQLAFVDSCRYLRVQLHATKGFGLPIVLWPSRGARLCWPCFPSQVASCNSD